MMRTLLMVIFVSLWANATTLRLALAANVSYAIEPLKEAFSKEYPHITIEETLGSSGKLTAQIRHGAPYDLFLSANMAYPNALFEEGFALRKPIIYAQGALALLSTSPRDYCADMMILKDPTIKKIAIANPKTAPYGMAGVEAIQKANLFKSVKEKLIYGESISQTVIYTLRVADIGIIAKSALFSPKLSSFKEAIHWHEVDRRLYTPIDQGMVLLKQTKHKREAEAFYHFIQSSRAKEILKAYGYHTP
jgi:molybdate transport system substrate-binding protein